MTTRRSVIRTDCNALIVFLKEPVPGRVKTRLSKGMGAAMAAQVYGRLLARTLQEAEASSAALSVYASEPLSHRGVRDRFRAWGRLRIQRGGHLGLRMLDAFERENRHGRGKAIIIGSDCPDLRAGDIRAAFRALKRHDAVLGPARDGGYYLIGFNSARLHLPRNGSSGRRGVRPLAHIFRGIRWGGPRVFDSTYRRMKSLGLRVKCLRALRDWDRLEDLSGRSLDILYPIAQT